MPKLDEWLEQRGGIQKPTKGTRKKLTTRERFERALGQQVRLANGETILGAKGKPIRSWFKDGKFTPKVGVYSLLEAGAYIPYQIGEEISVINQFMEFFNDRELDRWIEDLDIKISQARLKREEESRAKDGAVMHGGGDSGFDPNRAKEAAKKSPQEYLVNR